MAMKPTRTMSLALAVVVVTSCQTRADEIPGEKLIAKIPGHANAVVLIDLKSLFASPLAQREHWDRKHDLDLLGGAFPFSSKAGAALRAAHLEPGSLKSSWDLGLFQGGAMPTLAEIARQEQGVEQKLGDVAAVLTPKNCFYIALTPEIRATYSPAHRQDAARWSRFALNNTTPELSDYLRQALGDLKQGYQIVVAVDMTDSVDPNYARKYLSQSPLLRGKQVDVDGLVRVLTSTRGIRIGLNVEQMIRGTLAGDFGEDIKPYADIVPALVLKTLDDLGAELDEFSPAAAVVQGKSFLITTQISTKGLRHVLNLVPAVAPPLVAGKEMAPAQEKAPVVDVKATATKRFFSTAVQRANEAHTLADKRNDFIRAATAYEKAADQIDKLSGTNVDEEVLAYGNRLSSKLRTIAEALRGAVLEASVLENEKVSNVQLVHPGGYVGSTIGYWNPNFPNDPRYPQGIWIRPYIVPPQYSIQTNEPQVQGKQAEILARGARKRLELWRQLTEDTGTVRKKMTTKYNIDF
jgi:hypothetical protein